MTIRQAAVVAAAALVMGGCSGSDSAAPPTTTTTITTTTTTTSSTDVTPPTTTAAGSPDQQVCTGLQTIEARGFQSTPEELLGIGAIGGQSTTREIVLDSAFLSAAATAGDLQRAGEIVLGMLETCRQKGLI